MTYKNLNNRLATTAIAAVLAFTATPLLAQDASIVPEAPADPVVETPEPATPDPLAPEATAPETTTAAETTPVEPAAAAKTSTVKRSTAVSRTTASKAAAPVRTAVAPPEVPAEAPAPIMVPEMPVAEPVLPVAAEPAPTAEADVMDDVLPVAGGTALGLLAIAGAAMAMRRRKRREEEEEFAERQTALAEAEPVAAVPEPAFVRTAQPVHDAIPAKGPVTDLPEEFDLSRFGRHVQAAYRGPTADNPSLSLKNRLRRASFYDQQERKAAEAAAEQRVADLPNTKDWDMKNGSDFMLRRAGTRVPAYQQ